MDVTIAGVLVRDVRLMNSKFAGFCLHSRRRFPADAQIVFKGANNLTDEERAGLFPNGGVGSVVALYSEVQDSAARVPVVNQGRRPAQNNVQAPTQRAAGAEVRTGKPSFTPSTYQMNVLESFLQAHGNILIRALAGTGKTSTLVWLIWTLYERGLLRGKRAMALAFNKNIQRELEPQLRGANCPAMTTHSFLMRLMGIKYEDIVKGRDRNILQRVILDRLGLPITRDSLQAAKKSSYWELRKPIGELIGYIKAWAILANWDGDSWHFTPSQVEEIESLVDKYRMKIGSDVKETVVDLACAVICNSYPGPGEKIQEATFDDCLYLPLLFNVSFPRYDLIVNDECQDYNRCQIEILARLERAGARIICVGDENQAMYLFRGADAHAFERCSDMLSSSDKGMSVCELPMNYRSEPEIIAHAQEIVPGLLGFKTGRGLVGDMSFAQAMDEAQNSYNGGETWAFLCRINTPLIVTAYQLVAKKKRVCILGRGALATPLWNLIDEVCGEEGDPTRTERISDLKNETGEVTQEGLVTRLASHYKVEMAKWGNDEKYATQLENLRNNIECIEIISMQVSDDRVQSVKDEIDALFSDTPEAGVIVLSTIHGAKGLEWDNVVCIRPELIPFPTVQMYDADGNITDEYQQEVNIDYVMRTRAKRRLYRLSNWPFGRQGNNKTKIAEAKRAGEIPSAPAAPVVQAPLASLFDDRSGSFKRDGELGENGLPTGFVQDPSDFGLMKDGEYVRNLDGSIVIDESRLTEDQKRILDQGEEVDYTPAIRTHSSRPGAIYKAFEPSQATQDTPPPGRKRVGNLDAVDDGEPF